MESFVDLKVFEEAKSLFGRENLQWSMDGTFEVVRSNIESINETNGQESSFDKANIVHKATGPCAVFGASVLTVELNELERDLREKSGTICQSRIEKLSFIVSMSQRELNSLNQSYISKIFSSVRNFRFC